MKLKKVLVAVNGNKTDEEAVNLACAVARKSKAEIFIVHVIEVKRSLPVDAEIQAEIIRAEEILDKAENIASDSDCTVKTDLIQAREAGAAIVDEAREREIDLIIMGLNYKKRFGMFSLGRTVPYIMEEAPCKVILLREHV